MIALDSPEWVRIKNNLLPQTPLLRKRNLVLNIVYNELSQRNSIRLPRSEVLNVTIYYRIAGNFRGAKFSWSRSQPRKYYPQNLEVWLIL